MTSLLCDLWKEKTGLRSLELKYNCKARNLCPSVVHTCREPAVRSASHLTSLSLRT